MTLPFTNPENFTGVSSLFSYNNSITDGLFMPIMLFVVWFILFIVLKTWDTRSAFSSSGFIMLLLTIILRAASLVNDFTLAAVFLVFLAGSFLLLFDRSKPGGF